MKNDNEINKRLIATWCVLGALVFAGVVLLGPNPAHADETIETTSLNNAAGYLGDVSSRTQLAQRIDIGEGGEIVFFQTNVAILGSPTDNLLIDIRTDNAGEPSGTSVLSSPVVVAGGSLVTSCLPYDLVLSQTTNLDPATSYWVVFYRSTGVDGSNHYVVCGDNSSASGLASAAYNGASWTSFGGNTFRVELDTIPATPEIPTAEVNNEAEALYYGFVLYLIGFWGVIWFFRKTK